MESGKAERDTGQPSNGLAVNDPNSGSQNRMKTVIGDPDLG